MECFDAIAWAIPPYFRGDGGRTENYTLRGHPNLAVTSNICRSDPSFFFWEMGIMMPALWHLCLKSSAHVWSVEKGDYVSYLHRRGLLKEKKKEKSECIHEHEHVAWNSNKWFHLLNSNWITRGGSAINAWKSWEPEVAKQSIYLFLSKLFAPLLPPYFMLDGTASFLCPALNVILGRTID